MASLSCEDNALLRGHSASTTFNAGNLAKYRGIQSRAGGVPAYLGVPTNCALVFR